jgi:hypothetical protein
LILPIFVHEDTDKNVPIPSMPGVERLAYGKNVLDAVREAKSYGVKQVVIFPKTPDHLKTVTAEEAFNPDGLSQRTIRLLKDAFAEEVEVYTDVALDPYSCDGHDGIVRDDGVVLNDETVEYLCRQAVSQAEAGADVVSPSGELFFGGLLEGWRVFSSASSSRALAHGRFFFLPPQNPTPTKTKFSRHDGRPRRRHPCGLGQLGLHRRLHHVVHGQVRVCLLRPLPRRACVGAPPGFRGQAHPGQQARVPDGPGQLPRGERDLVRVVLFAGVLFSWLVVVSSLTPACRPAPRKKKKKT